MSDVDDFEAFRQKRLAERELKKREQAQARRAAEQAARGEAVTPPQPGADGEVMTFRPTEDRGDSPALATGYESHSIQRGEIEVPPPPAGIERIEKFTPGEQGAPPAGFESHRVKRETGGDQERPAGFESHRHAQIPAEEIEQEKPEGFESGRYDR